MLIEINDEFQTNGSPQIRQRNINADGCQFYFGVERKKLAVVDEAIEGIAVEMIAVRRIGGPVGVGVMRRDNGNASAAFCDAIEFCDQGHYVGNVLNDVTANNFVELVVGKRIRHSTQIMNNIRMSPGV